MEPVVTPAEMAERDRETIAAGTPEAVLVERAGHAVARAALQVLGGAYGRRVVVVCGTGNNGADGRVAARVLRSRGVGVDVFALGEGFDRAACSRALDRAHLLVDAMFGTGFHGGLTGDAAWAAREASRSPRVLAVDIPSGVDGLTGRTEGPAVLADATVTFAARKPGLLVEPGRSHAGSVAVADLGIDPGSPALGRFEAGDVADRLPARHPEDHKWSAGLLVVAGSAGMTGAALLVSRAALRTGAGMVVCGLPGPDAAARASGTEVVTRPLAATPRAGLAEAAAGEALDVLDRFHALVVGPGLGRDPATRAAIGRIVAEADTPVVVDADALDAVAVDAGPLQTRRAAGLPVPVLTPHAGEFARLAGDPVGADRVAATRALAVETGCVVLLKGPGTVVAAPSGRAVLTPTGGPELATAGTGDVLSGVVGALLAQGLDPFEAAAVGAWVHGRAADALGPGLVASDLIAELPRTLARLRDETLEG